MLTDDSLSSAEELPISQVSAGGGARRGFHVPGKESARVMTITESTPHTGHHVRPDPQCWAEATDYLVELLGSAPDSLC